MNVQLPMYLVSATRLQERPDLSVTVDQVAYTPGLDAPGDRPFAFVYSITVRNGSGQAVTIKGRKWVVTEQLSGRCHIIEGDGIIGRLPRLGPGGAFSYRSYHVVAADSVAEGSLLIFDDAQKPSLVRIPRFAMRVPR